MDNIDFIKEILRALKLELSKYRVPLSILSLIIMSAILYVGSTWQKQFESTATLFIDDSNIIQPLLEGRAEFSETTVVDEAKEMVMSRPLIASVAQELGYIDLEKNSDEEISLVINAIQSGLSVDSENKKSKYFTVSYLSRDPETSFKTTQVLVRQIVEQQRQSQTEEGKYAYNFISSQAENYRKRLEKAEDAVKDFRARSIDVDEKIVQDGIREIEKDIQTLELSLQESESVVETTRSQLNVESRYLEVQSKVYTIRQNKSLLERQLGELRMQYQESYPDIVTIKTQILELDQQLDDLTIGKNISPRFFSGDVAESNPELIFDELRKQLNVETSELKAKQKRLSSLKKLLVEQHSKLEKVAENQAQLAELMRDYNVTKDTYEELLSRKENAGISVAITEEGQGLTYRVVNEPSFPLFPTGLTFLHFVLVAPILGIGIPIGLILALILLDPRIRTVSTLGSELSGIAPLLGVSPKYHTSFAQRLIRKDMMLLSMLFSLFFIGYFYVFYLSLNA